MSHIIHAIILLTIFAESPVVISGKSITQSGGVTIPAALILLILRKHTTRNVSK